MTTTNDKLRSLFLAALMVFSVFAMTVALPGSAAANHSNYDDYDDELTSGSTYWQGQELLFTDEVPEDGTYEVRNYDSGDDNVGQLAKQVEVNEDGSFVLGTSDLDGQYVIEAPGGGYLNLDTDGHAVEGSRTTSASDADFEITTQDLEAEFDDTNVTDEDDDVTLEVDSRRSSYDVNVSADGDLDTGELQNIFAHDNNDGFTVSDTYEDEDTITLSGVSDGEYSTNFTDVDTGEYTFDFEVTDTSASSSESINVSGAAEGDIDFANDTPIDQTGDVADITVEMENTDEGTITIGSADENYWITAQLTDGDEDGEVTVQFNSYTAGTSGSYYQAADDAESNTVLGVEDSDDEVSVQVENGSFTADHYTDEGQLVEAGANAELLEATEYHMNVTTGHSDGLDVESDNVGSLSLQDRSTDNVSIMTAPVDDVDFDDIDTEAVVAGVGSNVTETDEVAENDWAVIQIQASGLEGYYQSLSDESTDFFEGDITELIIEESDPGANADAQAYENWENVEVVADADNNTYYVALPTDSDELDQEGYEAEFSVQGQDGDNVLNFHEDDEDESVSGQFEIVEGESEFDVNEDDLVLVEAADNQTVSGTTNWAPGTELRIQISSDDATSPFLTRPDAVVQSDGTFEANVDFSELGPGTNLTLTIDRYDDDVEQDGQVVEEGSLGQETETPSDNETETPTEEPTETATEEPTEAATEEPTETDTPTPSDDSGPGFTVIAALGALIAAALLAVRRNN